MVSVSYVKFVAVISMAAIFLGPLPSTASEESDEKTITLIGHLSCNRTCASGNTANPPQPLTPVNGAAVRLACTYNKQTWYNQTETKTEPDGTFILEWTKADIFNTGTCAVWIDWAPADCNVPVKPDFEKNGYKVDWADVNTPIFGIYTPGCLQVSPPCPSN